MDKKINLEEIIQQCIGIRPGAKNTTPMDYYECKFVMKELARQLLELAAENADVEEFYRGKSYRIDNAFYENDDSKIVVNKQSILDTIKQVE